MFGPQLLAAIPDFSLEYAYTNWRRFIPTYPFGRGGQTVQHLPARPVAGAAGRQMVSIDRTVNRSIGALCPNGCPMRLCRSNIGWPRHVVFAGYKERSPVIAVTSAVKGEGKTRRSSILAIRWRVIWTNESADRL